MRLSDHPDDDERLLEIHLIAQDIVNQVCAEESKLFRFFVKAKLSCTNALVKYDRFI